MVDYTGSMRLRKPTIGADDGQWATYTNNDWDAVDAGVNGILQKSIAGLTSYTLVADGSTGDEARYASFQFSGALSGDCTVTVPADFRWGRVRNITSGSHNVILSTGAGLSGTVPPDGYWYTFQVSGVGVTVWPDQIGPTSIASDGYYTLPGGLIYQWGTKHIGATGSATVTFPQAFPTVLFVFMPVAVVTTFGAFTVQAGNRTLSTGNILASNTATGAAYTGGIDAFWWAVGK